MLRTGYSLFIRISSFALACILGAGALSGCEKDDICVDGDTPLLIIKFLDDENPDNAKNVNQLRVLGLGKDEAVDTFLDRSTLDSIAIPLQPGETQTTFILIQDSEDEEEMEIGNPDTVRFDYATREVFISRACGFVAQYENLESELQQGSENWIRNIEVENTSVQNLDSTHVSIFH
ncbi:MAG: DUF6452 family protein [Robiginitalea sp.]|uniref:DUF6452 family protein n=1 Tax=Robiginitalea sp. TaxID=1902411 RepID=UPI003C7062A9